ncbi:MAG: ribose 5-phosphate isomerase B [bacterium]
MKNIPSKIVMGSDHAGYNLKEKVKSYLQNKGIEITDLGTHSDEKVDYPDYVHPLAEFIKSGEFDFGIVMCGSGNGVSITANKHQHIRCALSWIPKIAELGRKHNNANVLALPGRFLQEHEAYEIVDAFLNTEFEGGRHQRRIDKIPCSGAG